MIMHWYEKDLNRSFNIHYMFDGKKQYFSICNHIDYITIFTELMDEQVYRQAIFAPREEGPYRGMDGGMDIAYPPAWRRRTWTTKRFDKSIRIMGTEE